jgi:hypothetical protein
MSYHIHLTLYIPPLGHNRLSTSASTSLSISILTVLSPLSIEKSLTFDRPTAVNPSSLVSFLPRWDTKIIKVVGVDVNDVSFGRQT